MLKRNSKLVYILVFFVLTFGMAGCWAPWKRSVWDKKYYEYQPTFIDRAAARTIAKENDFDEIKDYSINGIDFKVINKNIVFTKFDVSIPINNIQVSDADVVGFSSDIQKALRHRLNKARRVRLGSGTLQVIAAAVGATLGFTIDDAHTAAAFGVIAAVIPELQNIFQARGRAEAYTDGLELIQDAHAFYHKKLSQTEKRGLVSTSELTVEGGELLVQIAACLKLVDKALLTHIPTIEELKAAKGRIESELEFEKIKERMLENKKMLKLAEGYPTLKNDTIISHGNPVRKSVLANDDDYDGVLDPLTLSVSIPPADGTAVVSNGIITYTPNAGVSGHDVFKYTVSDNDGNVSEALVAVTLNIPPTATPDSITISKGSSVPIAVLTNDSDKDGKLLPETVIVSVPPANGIAVGNSDGTIKYAPNNGFTGSDSFKYKVKDDLDGFSNEATVTVTINKPPTANPDSSTVPKDSSVTIHVLSNDNDSDGSLAPSTVIISVPPGNGTCVVNSDGTIQYKPSDDYTGSDSFNYKVKDDFGEISNETTVTITVN